LTPEERRERARLRSERWRRAHGIPRASPHKGRGWYRRRAKGREEAALVHTAAVLDRLQWQVVELRAHLDKMAMYNAAMAAELGTP
jgi:hypothetical protein